MRLTLFEVAVLTHPSKKEAEEGKKTELTVKPQLVLAKDEKTAVFKAVKDHDLDLDIDGLEVVARPF